MDYYVIDTRSKNRQGPFTKNEADKYAEDLNDFVKRNAGIQSKPFVVKPG